MNTSTGKVKLCEFEVQAELYSKKDVDSIPKTNINRKTDSIPKISIIKMTDRDLEIDFINFPVSVVNAYRRIILAEVATMAIEKVHMYNNTSLIQDEVLAHRLGLIPLEADPAFFEDRTADQAEWGAHNSIKYELKVKCVRNKDSHYVKDKTVYSSHLKWQPLGNQSEIFSTAPLNPLHEEIILAKLNPEHEINLEAYAVKGIGSDHAKFQPGLAWYRMLPEVTIIGTVEGDLAKVLQGYFSPGVIEVETNSEGKLQAKVGDARYDSCSRNVFMDDSLKDSVKLTRNTDHIIFYIESTSALKSIQILEKATDVLGEKCDNLLTELEKYLESGKK